MEQIYNQISKSTKEALEIAAACKGNEEITLRLSRKLLKVSEALLTLSKRVEGGVVVEIEVLVKKIRFFLEKCKNESLFTDIHEISMRIIEEASSY